MAQAPSSISKPSSGTAYRIGTPSRAFIFSALLEGLTFLIVITDGSQNDPTEDR